jgi:hypothetical protein
MMLSVFPETGPLPTTPPATGEVDDPDTAPVPVPPVVPGVVVPSVVLEPSGAVTPPEPLPMPRVEMPELAPTLYR